MEDKLSKFVQTNSPDGGFLQSEYWRKFQESAGRKTFKLSANDIYASIIVHHLSIAGNYFYIPRGPISCNTKHETCNTEIKKFFDDLISLAEKKRHWLDSD